MRIGSGQHFNRSNCSLNVSLYAKVRAVSLVGENVVLVEVILSALAEAALSYSSAKAKGFFARRNATRELATTCAHAIEQAIEITPALAEDFRSESFIKSVIVPVVQSVIDDPSLLPDPEGVASKYIDMFVLRFAAEEGVDSTLLRIFQTDRAALKSAFVSFFATLRSLLYKSETWREAVHHSTGEQTLAQTTSILQILNDRVDANGRTGINLEAAASDAATGSAELREWPKDIFGQRIERAALGRLIERIESAPAGVALLIGEAGSGKSALLAELTSRLEGDGTTVFAIKADTLPVDLRTVADIGLALGMSGQIDHELAALALERRVVLIIDQLDAVSDVMDRSSARMRLLLRLVRMISDRHLPVHVVISSRPFEAAHDARFHQLQAEEFKLDLPTTDEVNALLDAVGIDRELIEASLMETLRRPFALKLFVEITKRGGHLPGLTSAQLLDRWLETASLGSESERANSIDLMNRLAADMITTETLWRPADSYEMYSRDALARCEACGLIVRNAGKIGFSHQSWLDDFQAKGFRTGQDLTEYAWHNQGSLFVRAAVLRSLQRLRLYEPSAYAAAAESLLFDPRTRRHLRHLVVDVFAVNPIPTDREAAWVEALLQSDPILARRAITKLVPYWANWRDALARIVPTLMVDDRFHWNAVQALAAEAALEPDNVANLIERHWDEAKFDRVAFSVVEQSGVITSKIEERLNVILDRTKIDDYAISHLVTTLRADQRFTDASRIVYTWAMRIEGDRHHGPRLHNVEKLAQDAPLELATSLLPWFIATAQKEVDKQHPARCRFPKSRSLPRDWNFNGKRDSPYEALRIALRSLAQADPLTALALVDPIQHIEIDEVQELVTETLMAGGAECAQAAIKFLRADERRFCIGDARVQLERGVSSTQMGLVSQELIEAISGHLDHDVLADFRDAIERWTIYSNGEFADSDVDLRRKRLQWADEHRMELLDRLPPNLLTPRRRRQISDWRTQNPRPKGKVNVRGMAGFVGSPMSETAMAKANDDMLFKKLDEIDDSAPERSLGRRFLEGGVHELGQAFAAFGKSYPERAIRIARERFQPGRHEKVAGALVSELSGVTEIDASVVLALVEELSDRGFESRSWRNGAAWALARVAERLEGLSDHTIARLERWIETDSSAIERQIAQRLEFEELDRKNNKDKEEANAASMLFGFGHGMHLLPQDNFTLLSAMASGYLSRSTPDCDGWLAALERHVERPEDPHIWSALLAHRGRWLLWADRERVKNLLDGVWKKFPTAFDSIDLLGFVWPSRAMFPDHVLGSLMQRWLLSADTRLVQAAAEFIAAAHIVDNENALYACLAQQIDDAKPSALLGRLFAAAAAWREDDPVIRPRGHAALMQFVVHADGDLAHAISTAVDHSTRLIADDLTIELVRAVGANPAILAASVNGRFADGLQSLLLYPGFDDLVLATTEQIVALRLDDPQSSSSYLDQDFVHVTVALQRSDGPLRERAMDIYERLLDAGVYGAEEAAKAAMGR